MEGSAGVIQFHQPLSEFLPDLLVLSQRQVSKGPVIDLSCPLYHVLFL